MSGQLSSTNDLTDSSATGAVRSVDARFEGVFGARLPGGFAHRTRVAVGATLDEKLAKLLDGLYVRDWNLLMTS